MRVWQTCKLCWLVLAGIWVFGLPLHTIAQAQRQPAPTPQPDLRADPRFVRPPSALTVPRVVGQSLDRARASLRQAGFESTLAPGQNSDGLVDHTDPPEGSTHIGKRPPLVAIFLRAPPQRLMPSIIGLTCTQATATLERATLERAKLVLSSCSVGGYTGRVPANTIHTQKPAENSPIGPDIRTVVAVVEPDTVVVPDVRNQPAPQAVQRLEQARLRARPTLAPVQPWLRVRDQRPAPGARVAPRSEVAIELVYAVPPLSRLDCDQARRLVLAAGHRGLDCRAEIVNATVGEAGRIFRQSPAADSTSVEPLRIQAFTPLLRVPVPALVGKLESAAQTELRQARLALRATGPTAAAGRVVAAQSPDAGTLVEPGTAVELRLALTVPRFGGTNCDGAHELARRHGFETLECRPRVAARGVSLGLVFEQTPPAGTVLQAPQTLEASIARGITVPQLTGLEPQAAIVRLKDAGLDGRSDGADGERIVTRQRPGSGAEVAPGTRVELTTQRMTRVPDVMDRTLDDAERLIASLGLRARSDAGGSESMRRVKTQRPAAGTRVAVGQQVELTAVLEVWVPDVVDQSLEEARALVERAKLDPQIDSSSRPERKVVRSQHPRSGSRVAAGSTVTLRAVSQVLVPELREHSCADAQAAVRDAGLGAEPCSVSGWFGLRLGTPRVWRQSLAAGSAVDEGSPLQLDARTSWVPVAGLGGAVVAALVAAALAIFVPKAPLVEMRIQADLRPRVSILARHDLVDDRVGSARDDAESKRAFDRALSLRVDTGQPQAVIRAWDPADHDAAFERHPNLGARTT